jgi:predicted metal-dependent hydrolase
VQFRLPFASVESTPVAPGAVTVGSGSSTFAVHMVRMTRAKRYVMRVRPDGSLRVTIPRGGSKAEALRFAARHLPWAVRQRARQLARPAAAPWVHGTPILLDGEHLPLHVQAVGAGVALRVGVLVACVSGSQDDYKAAVQRAMRAHAAEQLPRELLSLAARHQLAVRRVTVRDQRSRWGSCSPTGSIALNYRLVQMPPAVREYVLLHELAHLQHANHSRPFWKAVERMCPAFRAAERWLKSTGQALF